MSIQIQTLEFDVRTGKVLIMMDRCEPAIKNTSTPSCGFACVKACRLYGRNVLKIENNRPALAVPPDEASRLCNECLACEYSCQFYGSNCIRIILPFPSLDEYRRRHTMGR
ncbi:MAG: hypothetical protein N3F04_07485 [Candidatus Nezhaarchaeota archaeon]|nr:hypothetical protein [Candidatus Nezhaarchaeota archaeon]MCX8142587.1 hypothetical protein [Candidatus Nezhaarchaeota archaeon]